MEDNSEGKRKQELPEVKNVKINVPMNDFNICLYIVFKIPKLDLQI